MIKEDKMNNVARVVVLFLVVMMFVGCTIARKGKNITSSDKYWNRVWLWRSNIVSSETRRA